MKKHENAIKALMKNVKDNEKWYGYFEDENGARYLMNMHIVIKLTGSTLDYVGELPRLENIKLVKQFIDFIGTFKKGDYSANVNIDDVKIFDKYKELGECFKQQYADNKYIAFNPFYFCKLNILTRSDLLTITDNKSPMYIAGDDIECILLPCSLDKNYNSDNYEQFKEELKACYIQDEADKASRKEKREAKKNAETMTEIKEGETINGFYAYLSGREYFLKTDNKRVTKKVVEHFIKAVGIVKGKNADTIEKMTTLQDNVDYTKGRIYKATLKKNTIGNYTFIDIDGDNFSYGGNIDELKGKLYIFDFDALTPITFYQDEEKTNAADIVADPETTETKTADNMSATNTDKAATTDMANNDSVTDTQGIKSANNADTTQDTTNNAITTETMQADARQETKQTDTTQDTPHKTSKKAISLFVVTDKPQPVKLPHLKPLNNIPMFQERFKTDFKPLKNNKGYNTRVSNIKPLKKAYNDFVGTVSCYNDKRAISGGMVAVNSS